jgi:ketosteroid isomerase-like protein
MVNDSRIAAAQQFFEKAFRGEVSSAIELLDEEVSFQIGGSHRAAGHLEGREAVAQHLGALLGLTQRTFDVLQWEDWMAGTNHVAALAHLSVQPPGAILDFMSVYLIEVTDDAKIRRIEMFFDDQAAVENLNWWMGSGAEAHET